MCQVDWLGQKAQIDAAKKAGVEKVRSSISHILSSVFNMSELLGH
jgi:hypothetical protein